MVRALLAGRKTQTRRILKDVPPPPADDSVVHPPKHEKPYFDSYCGGKRTELNPRGMTDHWCWWTRDDRAGHGCKVPYVPGDRLWVKETWRTSKVADELPPRLLVGGGYSRIWYEADRDNCDQHGKVRVSIHMPRWASRLTLTVTDVRVQRLHDCSEEDAIAEGCSGVLGPNPDFPDEWDPSPQEEYRELWNSINDEPGKRWSDNPWIVAVTFTVEQRNINQVLA